MIYAVRDNYGFDLFVLPPHSRSPPFEEGHAFSDRVFWYKGVWAISLVCALHRTLRLYLFLHLWLGGIVQKGPIGLPPPSGHPPFQGWIDPLGGHRPPVGQAPPWGSWLRSRLRGEECDEDMVSVKMCCLPFSKFPVAPLSPLSRYSPGRA